jgi:hypothetical protein
MATYAGIECPICHEAATVNIAALPMVDQSDPANPVIILPHEYSVCVDCHRAQYVTKYGCTPEEAPGRAKPDPPPFVPKVTKG